MQNVHWLLVCNFTASSTPSEVYTYCTIWFAPNNRTLWGIKGNVHWFPCNDGIYLFKFLYFIMEFYNFILSKSMSEHVMHILIHWFNWHMTISFHTRVVKFWPSQLNFMGKARLQSLVPWKLWESYRIRPEKLSKT